MAGKSLIREKSADATLNRASSAPVHDFKISKSRLLLGSSRLIVIVLFMN